MRRTKIAGTLGPACDAPRVLAAMLEAGLDVARLNFSHGATGDHARRVRELRRAAARLQKPVALMADLQGPRFRVGVFPGGSLALATGSAVRLRPGRERAAAGEIPVPYAALAKDVRRGDALLLDDGGLVLRVLSASSGLVRAEVERGGTLADRKGINVPGRRLSAPALTAKDRKDLRLAVALGADWLAVSFVRGAEDLRRARVLLRRAGAGSLPLIAKIERPEAVDRLWEILEEADGVLVARGDLGLELPPERVPVLQKEIVDAANALGLPAITATHMLESMRHAVRPTRAEVSDVANAVLDGSACLLLTAETAIGAHPVEAIATMARIAEAAEASGRMRPPVSPATRLTVTEATCLAAARAAKEVAARYVVAFTRTGATGRAAARFRPAAPIVAFTPSRTVQRRLALAWGVLPRVLPLRRRLGARLAAIDRVLVADGLASPGDRIVVVSRGPRGAPGTTDLLEIHEVRG